MKHTTGFSIIEVIIALFVLSLGIAGAFQILSSGGKLANTTEHRVVAVNLARLTIEGTITVVKHMFIGSWAA